MIVANFVPISTDANFVPENHNGKNINLKYLNPAKSMPIRHAKNFPIAIHEPCDMYSNGENSIHLSYPQPFETYRTILPFFN